MDQKKLQLYAITALFACVGLIIGTITTRKFINPNREAIHLSRTSIVREHPTSFADITSINKLDKVTVLEKIDFSKPAKDYPTVIRTKRPLTLTCQENNKQYALEADALFRVVEKNKHGYTIEAKSNKQDLVRLSINSKDAAPMEEGLWKLVEDKKGQTGWLKIEK